ERVERTLGTRKQPVDRALFVALHMVVEEVAYEIFANVLAERVLDEGEVVLELRLAEGDAQEGVEARGNVVPKPVAVEDGYHVVGDGFEGRLWAPRAIGVQAVAPAGEDQARRVEAVAAEHAAHRIGDELAHGVGAQQVLKLGVGLLAAVAVGRVTG